MDKKLIEILEEAMNQALESLASDKSSLEAEIGKEQNKSIEKTYIQEEFEEDLKKVETEIDTINSDSEQLKELVEKENNLLSSIEDTKRAIESLQKDKEALEKEIEGLEGISEFENGKLKKSSIQEKNEADLDKVLKEIAEKEQTIDVNTSALKQIETSFKGLTDKYHVKKMEDEKTIEQEENLKERQEQEDKMWEEYRKEPDIEGEIDTAYEEKQKAEQEEEERIENSTKQEIEDFARTEEVSNLVNILANEAKRKAAEESTKQTGTGATKGKVEEPKGGKRKISPNPNNSKYTIKEVNFRIEANNVPCYEAIITDADGQEFIIQNSGFESITPISDDQIQMLESRGITEGKRYYDVGLVKLLEMADKQYGTTGVKQYETMLKQKYMEKKDDELDIDYDFSELYNNPNMQEDLNKIKYLKRVANNNYKLGLASYEKAPNVLKRIWRRVTQKLLPKGKENDREQQSSWVDDMFQHYQNESKEQGFDLRRFTQQISRSETVSDKEKQELLSKINADGQEQAKTSKESKFKDELKVDPLKGIPEHVAADVARFKKEEAKNQEGRVVLKGEVVDLPKDGMEK